MESGRTHISEEVIQAGGEQKVLSTYKSPLYDLDGTVMGTVVVALDVTLERAYAQEITRKNQMLEAVFTSIDCGILCHSLDGTRIISINQAALRILDYPTQEELAADGLHSVSRWVVEEDRTQLQKKLHSLKKVGDTANLDYRILHKDGSLLHIMGSFKLIEEDEEIFYQQFLLDCTLGGRWSWFTPSAWTITWFATSTWTPGRGGPCGPADARTTSWSPFSPAS